LLTLALSLILFHSPSPFAQERESPFPSGSVVHLNVDLVSVSVSVTDSSSHFIRGLHKEDFRVFDNGVERPLSGFVETGEPAQILFLIECSPSVFFLKESHIAAAYLLMSELSPADRVAVVTYSDVPKLILDFTPDKLAARAALQSINMNYSRGDLGLNLSSSLASTFDWLKTLPGQKTVVLLSTGIDTSSRDRQFIERELEGSDTRILAVSLLNDLRATPKELKHSPLNRADRAWLQEGFSNADQSMREISQVTGGNAYFPRTANDLDHALADIFNLTRHEYLFNFEPASRDGQLHTIKVIVKHSPRHVAYRQAYLAPLPAR
jgi:VWFA-related protein